MHLHGRLSRSAGAASRWRTLLTTLAATDAAEATEAAAPQEASAQARTAASTATSAGRGDPGALRRSTQGLQQELDRVLARGDPGLDSRLLEIPVRAYGSGAASVDLSLPEVE